MKRPEKIYERVVEIDERVRIIRNLEDDLQKGLDKSKIISNESGEHVEILKKIDEKEVEDKLIELKKDGIEAISVIFLHSPSYEAHEEIVGNIA
jgi:5-oxoprolinase (ATP-hydrolysing)